MTAAVVTNDRPLLAAPLAFVLGATLALTALGSVGAVAFRSRADAPRELLLRSPCAAPVTLRVVDTARRPVAQLVAREPGVYRMNVRPPSRAALAVGLGAGRPLEEFPVGGRGELIVPVSACPPTGGMVGLGNGPF